MADLTDPYLQDLSYQDLEPYTWYGTVFFHDFIDRHHISIAPDDASDFHVHLNWQDRGPRDMLLQYRVNCDADRLHILLHQVDFAYQMSRNADLSVALSEFGDEAPIAKRAIDTIAFNDLVDRQLPKIAEHHARGALELWRRAEIVLDEVREGLDDRMSVTEARERAERAAAKADAAAAMLRSVAPEVTLVQSEGIRGHRI